MFRLVLIVGLSVFLVGSAAGQSAAIVSDRPDEVAVTIYPDNLAMISEVRTVTLPAGRSVISFKGVNDRIMAETALLTEFDAITIERNFDYDLLSQQSLFENAVGEEVTLLRTLPGSGEVKAERATIVSGGQGVVFRIGDRVEALRCSGLSERVRFDDVPDGLKDEPTLSLVVTAEKAGPQRIAFRYLAQGFRWKADYILTETSKTRGEMIGWLTATNETGVTLKDAELSIVAGEVARIGQLSRRNRGGLATVSPTITVDASFLQNQRATTYNLVSLGQIAHCLPPARPLWANRSSTSLWDLVRQDSIVVTGSRISNGNFGQVATREDLGDYKLYRAPHKTTLKARQTKQILFLNKARVDYKQKRVFRFSDREKWRLLDADENDVIHAAERYDIKNSRRARLGEPLPKGTVRVMTRRQNGTSFYLGESNIANLAVGLPVKVYAGYTDEVIMTSKVSNEEMKRNRLNHLHETYDAEHEFTNMTGASVRVEFILELYPENRISNVNMRAQTGKAYKTWTFSLPPFGSRTLEYHFEADP